MGDMMGATPVYNVGGNDNSGFGGTGGTWIWVFFLFFLLAWGGGGFMGGNNSALQGSLTRSDLCQEFNFNGLENSVRAIQNGLCDGFYAMNSSILNGFNGNYRDMTNGFMNVNTGINSINSNINNLGYQMQNCCCETNRNIDAVRAENYKNTCDITTAIHAEGEATRSLITQNTIQELRDRLEDRDRQLMSANFQISQAAQTQDLIGQLQPVSKPAYITCSPYATNCGGCNC